VGRDLNLHKEHVAAEYVSRVALTEVTAAINRLGNRLDNLFIHLMSQSKVGQIFVGVDTVGRPAVIKGVLEVVLPLAMLVLFAMALGLALDNHAATLDPSTPHYVAIQKAP
jgi:hypothetical protein